MIIINGINILHMDNIMLEIGKGGTTIEKYQVDFDL